MMGQFSLLPYDDGNHSLLEPPSPAYTNVTVRRAFIVWLHCGQQNEFRHVCNYFHYLESMEERLTPEDRASSRLQEFKLLSDYPPSSYYLASLFPKLYRHSKTNKINVKKIQEIKLEDCVFNLEGYHNMKIQKGVTTKDIIKTSQMIRKFCKTHSKTLKNLLVEFQNFAKKTESSNSVNNIAMYIKRKYLKDELETWKNLPRTFSFLDISEETAEVEVIKSKLEIVRIKTPTPTKEHIKNGNKHDNKIRILINESRRKDLMTIIPNYSDLKVKESEKDNYTTQSVLLQTLSRETGENYDFTPI